MHITKYIISDIEKTTRYIPNSVFAAVIMTGVALLAVSIIGRGLNYRKIILYLVFAFYLSMMLEIAFFSREPGSRDSLDMVLFSTWGTTAMSKAFVVENILMFIPFGMLVPCIWKRLRKLRYYIVFPFLCSVLLESLQYIMKRGYCQLDDVVTNTLGGVIGFMIYRAACKIMRYSKQKRTL